MQERVVLNSRVFANDALKLKGIRLFQQPFNMHRQQFAEVVFVVGGRGDYGTGAGFRGEISAGDILFVPIDGKHAYYAVDALEIIGLLFVPESLPMPLLNLYALPQYRELFGRQADYYGRGRKDYPRLKPSPEEFAELKMLLEYFLLLQNKKSEAGSCERLGLFMCIIGRLCDMWRQNDAADAVCTIPDIDRVSTFLADNCGKNISLPELAEMCSVSVSSLLRHFRRAFGTTPAEYLKNLRLDKAATLLQSTSLRVEEIADQCGFSSSSYFISVFRKKFSVTPEVFRTSGAAR